MTNGLTKTKQTKQPKLMKHLYFIRHGQSIMNTQFLCSGVTDTPLTSLGIQQAHDAAREIKKNGMSFDVILSSPLSRAYDTACIISEAIGFDSSAIECKSELAERDFGVLEGKNMTDEYGIETRYYFENPYCIDLIEGVEKLDELHERAKKLIDQIKLRSEETILLVSHGALLRSIQRVLQDLPADSPIELIDNAKLIKLI